MIQNDDTIVALASPLGIAAIGIIRLSGSESLNYLKACFILPESHSSNKVYVGYFSNPEKNEHIDQICAVYFKNPASYTGEDSVEIHCHSSIYVINTIIQTLIQLGARLAAPGEFSKRAYINGKLSLTQSESVIDLIHSETKLQHQISLNRVEGKLLKHIQSIRSQLLLILEQVEGSIDFPDEVPPIDKDLVKKVFADINQNLLHIITMQDLGKTVSDGVQCLLIGKPNTGKSSLFNALLGENRSIVTDIPGTTRDYISETFIYNDIHFHLYDTAGLRESEDVIEYLGMEKIQSLISKSALILWVCDYESGITNDDQRVFNQIKDHPKLGLILNKADKKKPSQNQLITEASPLFSYSCSSFDESAITQLKQLIYDNTVLSFQNSDLEFMCNIRQQACLKQLLGLTQALSTAIQQSSPDDMLAIDLRQCVECCSEFTGDSITEEVLDGIFSRFCVGK